MHVRCSRLFAVTFATLSAAATSAQQAPLTFDQATPPPAYGQPATPTYGDQLPQSGALVSPTPADPAAMAPPVGVAGASGVLGGQGGAVVPPQPPFVLDQAQANYVVQTLQTWEAASAKVNTFNAAFDRFEYDDVFGPGRNKPMIQSTGVLSYSKPDKGSFKIDTIRRWTKTDPNNAGPEAPGEYVEQKDEVGEHWVCDGKAIYEYEHRLKQLRVTTIPPAMRGAAIVDGPLPFLFGADAKKLMDRYWIRGNPHPTQIWLEAYPKRQADAANYDYVEVLLDPKTMQPTGIQVHLPGGQQKHAYAFQTPTINGRMDEWIGRLFSAPRTPLGWKRVMTDDELPPAPQAANAAAPPLRQ